MSAGEHLVTTLEELEDEFRLRDSGKLAREAPTGVYGS